MDQRGSFGLCLSCGKARVWPRATVTGQYLAVHIYKVIQTNIEGTLSTSSAHSRVHMLYTHYVIPCKAILILEDVSSFSNHAKSITNASGKRIARQCEHGCRRAVVFLVCRTVLNV